MNDVNITTGKAIPLPTTELGLRRIKPAATETEYQHTKIRELRLRVRPTGSMSWSLFKRVDGRQVRHTIGSYPSVGLATAEKVAAKLLSDIALGTYEPKSVSRARQITLGEALDQYIAFRSTGAKKLSPRTIDSYRSDINITFGSWLNRPLSAVTPGEIATKHAKRSEKSPARADGAVRVIRALVNWSSTHTGGVGGDLIRRGMQRRWNNVSRRSDHVDLDKASAWFHEAGKHGQVGRALQVLLLTGLRRNEVLSATPEQIDLVAKTISVTENKASRPLLLPLSDAAIGVLTVQMAERNPRGKFIFQQQGTVVNLRKPIADPRSALNNISAAIGMTGKLTVHGLRRTYSTLAARFASEYIVKRLLNHAVDKQDVTASYIQIDITEMRRVTELVSSLLTRGEHHGD